MQRLWTISCIFSKFLCDELQIPSSEIVNEYHGLRYAFMLCDCGVVKVENGQFNNKEKPLRSKPNFIPPIAEDVVTVE